MSQREFTAWIEFYRLHPFDDMHRVHRPAALVAGAIGGGNVAKLLEWLAPEPVPEGFSAADLATMKAFGLKPQSKKPRRKKE
jgi:hypothetical protein